MCVCARVCVRAHARTHARRMSLPPVFYSLTRIAQCQMRAVCNSPRMSAFRHFRSRGMPWNPSLIKATPIVRFRRATGRFTQNSKPLLRCNLVRGWHFHMQCISACAPVCAHTNHIANAFDTTSGTAHVRIHAHLTWGRANADLIKHTCI